DPAFIPAFILGLPVWPATRSSLPSFAAGRSGVDAAIRRKAAGSRQKHSARVALLRPARNEGISVWVAGFGSAAALGLPGAGAGAAAPLAGTKATGQPPGAGRTLVAGADQHRDRTIALDLAGHADQARAVIEDRAVGNADRITVGSVAAAFLGQD